jgi:hypothetical protein
MSHRFYLTLNKFALLINLFFIGYLFHLSTNNQKIELEKCSSEHLSPTILYYEQRFFNLTHVIIPFHIKQIKILQESIEKKWSKYVPCTDANLYEKSQLPKVIFFAGYLEKIDLQALRILLQPLIKYLDCFSNGNRLDIITYEFNKDNDKHVLGSRLMFEHVLARNDQLLKDAAYVFYMEPDTRPVRSNWLIALQKEIGMGSSFWIRGSMYRGFKSYPTTYMPNKYHINGNAIYNIGDDSFRNFYFKILRPYVIAKHGDSANAYDTDSFEYLMDIKNQPHVRHLLQNFHFTDVIHNLRGQEFNLSSLLETNHQVHIIHSGNYES